jgi:hypothetical protein
VHALWDAGRQDPHGRARHLVLPELSAPLAEAANNGDDAAADGIQDENADQQECEDHQGRAALAVAVSACDRHCGNADEKRNGEERSAGLGEPKPVTQPPPIASGSSHA